MRDILLIFSLLVAGAVAADKSSSAGGLSVQVKGQSGKITIGRADPPSKDPNSVTVQMDELKEVDKDGNEVGKTGNPKHSFNSFASQDFTFGDLKSVTYEGLDAKSFDFTSVINGGTLRIITYIFTEKGSFKNGNETIEVNNGTFKFNIEMKNWTFCDGSNCRKGNSDEFGMYLDLTITMKGKGQAKKEEQKDEDKGKKPKEYELGGGAEILLSSQVKIDGEDMAMPEGYPMLTTSGSKDSFIFRFPKFNNTVLYDPVLNLEGADDDDDDDNGGATAAAPLAFSLLALVAAQLLALM